MFAALLYILCLPAIAADHTLYAAMAASKGYVVGGKIPPSGLFAREPGAWSQRGHTHPFIASLDYDPRDSRILYIAAGNGCIRSTDSGRTWRILTGWDMTELRSVSVDPNQPDHIYIGLPDGIAVSRDQGQTWKRLHPGFTQWLQVDRTRAGRILSGTSQGIVLSDDAGAHWRTVGARDAMINHLAQSPHDAKWWIAVSQSHGAFESRDGGATWRTLPSIPKTFTLYNVSFDPRVKNRVAIAGWGLGVLVSNDGARSWTDRSAGLPSKKIWRVAFDPDHDGVLHAAVHEEAVYRTEGAGWRTDGLDGSIVYDLVFVPAVSPRITAFEDRRRKIIEQVAKPDQGGYATIAARLYLGHDYDWCSRRLMELVKDTSGDMFWMFQAIPVSYLGRGKLSAESLQALRQVWKTYYPYRGDTENHWLLYYSTLYLMTQLYPNEPADSWYNGKSSIENFKESEAWLLSWMNTTTTIGQGEYDCTHYIGVYLLPLSYLAEWSTDPKMRKRAENMIEYVIADYAVENLNGIYVGAHARTDDRQVLEKWAGMSSDIGWMLFGLGYPLPGYGSYSFFYAVASGHMPSEVLHEIATDRSKDYVHHELKRTRNRWRNSVERNAPVYKTTYMRHDYAVSSDQGGLLQPIQQHSWDVTWAVDDPRGVHNTMFSLHPYSSLYELQMYFTFMPDFAVEGVVRSKKTYDSPDKFLGGSRYEQIMQDLDTVIALYDIPKGTRFPHINGFFSKDLTNFEEHKSGWIFAKGGNTYLAYYPLAPYEWKPMDGGGRRLYSPHLKNGTIVQAAAAKEFPSFEAFREAILKLPLETKREPVPSVHFRSLRGHDLRFTYNGLRLVDGKPIRFETWKLFEGPFLNAEKGSHKLTLTHGILKEVIEAP